MAEKQYYRVCKSLNDKGILIPEGTDLEDYKKGEAYISVFKYNQKHKELFEKNGSVAGISDVFTDILYFDFDNKDLEQARKDTITTVNRLQSNGISSDNIKINFSGGKGFHLSIHTKDNMTPEDAKAIALGIAGDLKSFDSVIYNANRIIRIEGTGHQKTGLHKTPISFDELQNLSMTDIKKIAINEYTYEKPKKVKLPEQIIAFKNVEKKHTNVLVTDTVDYLSNPFSLQPWKLAISQGFFPDGQRSNALIILASTLKNKGMLDTQCYYSLKAAADMQSMRYGSDKFSKEEIWKNIIEQVYSNNWKDGSYSEDNFPTQLQQYFEDLGVPRKAFTEVAGEVIKLDDGFDDFIEYAADIDKYTMKFGIPSLDKALKVRKGHLIGLLAGPGIGKTSFAVTLLNNTSKESSNSLFFSMDMYKLNVFQKLIQRHTGYTEDELFDFFKSKDQEKIDLFRNILNENYKNVSFCFKPSMDIKEIRKAVEMEEEKLGEKLGMIVVDYLELIQTDKSDPTASSAEAINGLRELANDGRVVVVLLQPNKISSKPDQPLLSYNAAKGSGMIPQAVTAMITAHRPGYSSESPENDRFFSVNIVKNRNGALKQLDFAWDGKTQTISELDDEGRFQLSVLRDTKDDAEDDY